MQRICTRLTGLSVKKFFPDAIYACDRFHVMQEFNRRLTEVRIRR
ncbi:transposase [Allobaculum mucilyticum]